MVTRSLNRFKTSLVAWNPLIAAVLLLLIVILGLALRTIGLGNESLWPDEIDSIFTARESLWTILTQSTANKQPLYFLIMHFWTPLFGESEVSVRFPSLLFGLLTIPATFALANRIAGLWTAVAASFLVSISPIMVWFSQETRMYSMLALLLLLSTHFWLMELDTRERKHLALYALFAFLGVYTHYYFLPFVAMQAVIGGMVWLRSKKPVAEFYPLLAALGFVSSAILIRINALVEDLTNVGTTGYTDSTTKVLGNLFGAVGFTFFKFPLNDWPVHISIWVLVGIGVLAALRKNLQLTLVFALAAGALMVILLGHILVDLPIVVRYLAPAVPLWYILAGYGFTWLISFLGKLPPEQLRPAALVPLLGIPLLLAWTVSYWDGELHKASKRQIREAAAFVSAAARAGDAIHYYPARARKHIEFYQPNLQNLLQTSSDSPQCSGAERVWIVRFNDAGGRQEVAHLQDSCNLIAASKGLRAISVYLFSRQGSGNGNASVPLNPR